jgi:hypothetical protein
VTRRSGTFGAVEQLPSGHYRARYIGPDGRRYKAPTAFLSKADARGWLALRQSEIIRKAWTPPEATPKVTKVTFTAYANQWMGAPPAQGPHPRALPQAARPAAYSSVWLLAAVVHHQ